MNLETVVCVCCVCSQAVSHVLLFATPWTVARQAPLSMEFSWQEYQNGLPFPTTENLLDSEIKPMSLALAGVFFTSFATWEAPWYIYTFKYYSVIKGANLSQL